MSSPSKTGALPLVIVNPSSRGGRGREDWPRAAAALRTHFGPFACRFTESPGDATRIAKLEAQSGRRLILTFGGDGTVSEAARGILDSGGPCELGVLPHGTGADFLRTLATPRRLADAARALRTGTCVSIDVGSVAFGDGSRGMFVNSASFGLSAEVADRMNRDGAAKSRGRAAFFAVTLDVARRFAAPAVQVRLDGGPWRRLLVTSVSLHNGRFFGGGMKMAPKASLTDGSLDAVFVRRMPLGRLLLRSPALYWGAHVALPEVSVVPARSLEARSDSTSRRLVVELDGEIAGELPARFEVCRAALRVRFPP